MITSEIFVAAVTKKVNLCICVLGVSFEVARFMSWKISSSRCW